jgi:hypothetical protein
MVGGHVDSGSATGGRRRMTYGPSVVQRRDVDLVKRQAERSRNSVSSKLPSACCVAGEDPDAGPYVVHDLLELFGGSFKGSEGNRLT